MTRTCLLSGRQDSRHPASSIPFRSERFPYDRLRFIKPVFIADTIHVRVTVNDKRDSPKSAQHGIVVELCEVFNQRNEVVLACEHLLMVNRSALPA